MKTWMILLTTAVLLVAATALWSGVAVWSRLASDADELARLDRSTRLTEESYLALVAGVEEAGGELRSLAADAVESSLSRAELTARLRERAAELRKLEVHLPRMQNELTNLGARLDREQADGAARLQRLEERLAPGAPSAPIEATGTDALPTGVILPWLPRGGRVPAGWSLCDGTEGTPDLRGLFLRGADSAALAGTYDEGARMQPAGLHLHTTDRDLSKYSLPGTARRDEGDWRLLFDTGYPADVEAHGVHVHEDAHVPAHFTVAYIMKTGR